VDQCPRASKPSLFARDQHRSAESVPRIQHVDVGGRSFVRNHWLLHDTTLADRAGIQESGFRSSEAASAAAIGPMVRPRSLAPRRANEETLRQTKVLSSTTTLSGGESEESNPEMDPSDE